MVDAQAGARLLCCSRLARFLRQQPLSPCSGVPCASHVERDAWPQIICVLATVETLGVVQLRGMGPVSRNLNNKNRIKSEIKSIHTRTRQKRGPLTPPRKCRGIRHHSRHRDDGRGTSTMVKGPAHARKAGQKTTVKPGGSSRGARGAQVHARSPPARPAR